VNPRAALDWFHLIHGRRRFGRGGAAVDRHRRSKNDIGLPLSSSLGAAPSIYGSAMSEAAAVPAQTPIPVGLIAPGVRIGKYEIVHRIACGGMAEIYLARASGIHGFEKYVVLKRILPQYAANAEFVRMFLKEARVAASLDHANIAHVHDIGEIGGSTFFTMEYLHGEDLRHVVRHLDGSGGRLPLEHALEIVIGAASGLHFAHERRGGDGRSLGIVHRDISPANIVVTYDGGVKLVDFGIAKLATDPELSQRYALKGKLAYMSPEQLHNQPVDRRCDVYALGIVLYEITTHTRLFKGSSDALTLKAAVDGIIAPPSRVVEGYPPALERIVLRALARSREARYQTARELQVDLEEFVHEQRLRLSPAALAEWMEQTFGPKVELWHSPPPATGAVRDGTAATKVIPRADVDPVPRPIGVAGSVPVELSAPVGKRRRSIGALAAFAFLAVAVGAGGLWLARGGLGADAKPTGVSGPVLLVAEQGHVAVEHAPAPPSTPPTAPEAAATAPTAAAAPAPIAAPAPLPRARRTADSGGPARGASFSSTFARREGEIRRCFVEHPAGTPAQSEISLRFDVGRDGHVSSLAVLPPAVGASPLGACLSAVGKSTVFAKQAAPLTFRIPLTVHLESSGADR
jgi:serine/threonine protein kinase